MGTGRVRGVNTLACFCVNTLASRPMCGRHRGGGRRTARPALRRGTKYGPAPAAARTASPPPPPPPPRHRQRQPHPLAAQPTPGAPPAHASPHPLGHGVAPHRHCSRRRRLPPSPRLARRTKLWFLGHVTSLSRPTAMSGAGATEAAPSMATALPREAQLLPKKIKALAHHRVVAVSSGWSHSLAVSHRRRRRLELGRRRRRLFGPRGAAYQVQPLPRKIDEALCCRCVRGKAQPRHHHCRRLLLVYPTLPATSTCADCCHNVVLF